MELTGRLARCGSLHLRKPHRWHSDEGINYAYLLDNGNLLLLTGAPGDPAGTGGLGGSGAALLELDWEERGCNRYSI